MACPSSFCTICTYNSCFELVGLLLSLSVYHTYASIVVVCDSQTKYKIESISPSPKLDIHFHVILDKYSQHNRATMEKMGIWAEFQMCKAIAIREALKSYEDTLFLDSDIIVTGVLNQIDTTKDLGVSPHYMKKQATDKYGFFNGGMLWAKNPSIPDDWIEFTKSSRYFDQASIEDLAKKYSHFSFEDNYNIQGWRIYHHPEGENHFVQLVQLQDDDSVVTYNNKPVKCIHTHFREKPFEKFNKLFIHFFQKAKDYKVLAIIFRVIHDKWILRIPKQPMPGIAFHSGDSFRELAKRIANQIRDVEIVEDPNTIHCWITPTVLLYDRPTLQWKNEEFNQACALFLGNGDIKHEGTVLQNEYPLLKINPWIFWARKPSLLEELIAKNNMLYYDKRPVKCIFIGNYENSVQQKYRTGADWSSVVDEFHCTNGSKHKFSHEEYLQKLGQARFGLCLRGFGSKCHREIELMALGTVPVITPDVCIDSYIYPPKENIHFIRVNHPNELSEKINSIDKETWEKMSDSCYDWYQMYCSSESAWKTTIERLLYDN